MYDRTRGSSIVWFECQDADGNRYSSANYSDHVTAFAAAYGCELRGFRVVSWGGDS